MSIRIALVEDDQPFARTLQRYFALTSAVTCDVVFPNAEEALRKIPKLAPELLLVDINLPKMNGIEFVGQIVQRCPGMLCLMLTMYEESPLIFEALKAGACGYLLKRTPPQEIVTAIEEAKAGGSPMTPQIARHVVNFFQKQPVPPPAAPVEAGLAGREVEVLGLLAQGYLYKEIGESLGISTHTVNSHIRRIYEKLHVRSRSQAVAKYRGLIE
ncbi:two component transcriptional regulator, LuxR family [Chthoniobacter flavus Ellin428]|uniref:Two component transcriptional regulator, LuxR family n=1 Tax=Chthoniobacter flavus Ellin428 TaxID=497964 RepID=B4CYB5_9BACT|nr:response regulator transcription factor [Chthoniobacter flavus]EDY20456.1 two component transcriptional regulator, LuxR family [Chthoniobacter flavus Ellin428]TCO85600.1 LuxR family two component transcriptional regulator [Chthoniobacter flavus]